MATVHLDDVPQVLDPVHPNHDRDVNEALGTLSAGEKVFLVNQMRVKGDSYWQVIRGPDGTTGPVGWIPQLVSGELTLDPYRPDCPTTFPLGAADLDALGGLETVACFGNLELTLTGTVTCQRDELQDPVAGASFLDEHRHCSLDGALPLVGRNVTGLLDSPTPVESVDGRFLIRGHFDDAESHGCVVAGSSSALPDPGPVMTCRQMFVVSNATPLD